MLFPNLRLHEHRAAKAIRWLPAPLLAAALTLGGLPLGAAAEEEEIPFTRAEILVQLNDTDSDLGFHARLDGEPWKRLTIEDPRGRNILDIRTIGRLRKQGLTEIAFESAEPTFDELSPAEFFARFPAGIYEVEGRTLAGLEMESEAVFTHVIPAPPEILAPLSEDCDAPETVSGPVTISWEPVTTTHPEVGVFDPDIEITFYEVTVEREEPEPVLVQNFQLPPDVTELAVPEAFLALGTLFKFQVLVGEASGNETSSESCFEVAG